MILPWHINRAQNVTHSENRRTTGETAKEKKRSKDVWWIQR